jgi:hypothetical protein
MEARARALAAARTRNTDDPPPEAGALSRRSFEGVALTAARSEEAVLAFDSEEQWPAITPQPVDPESPRNWLASPRARWWSDLHWPKMTFAQGALFAVLLAAAISVWVVTAPVPQGWVTVTSDPAGAYVKVDGVLKSITPFGSLLPLGEHTIQVDYGPASRTQKINVSRGGETVVHLEMKTPPANATGGLQVSTESVAGTVWVDGTARGEAPVTIQDLAPGSHDVVVKTARNSVTRKVDVRPGTVSSLVISMNTASGAGSGWLTVSSPVLADIFEGDTLIGTTAAPRIMLASGRHDLSLVSKDSGYQSEHTVQIVAGQTSSIRQEIPRGTLFVNVLPWAEVWLDGEKIGDTPIGNLSVPVGRHELLVRHPELGQQRRTITVNPGTPVRVGLDLRK